MHETMYESGKCSRQYAFLQAKENVVTGVCEFFKFARSIYNPLSCSQEPDCNFWKTFLNELIEPVGRKTIKNFLQNTVHSNKHIEHQ